MPSLYGISVLPPNGQTQRASWIWCFRSSITQPQHSLFTLHAALSDDDAKLASGDGQFFPGGIPFYPLSSVGQFQPLGFLRP